MADLTLTIPYKPLSKSTAQWLCWTWAVIEIFAICWFFVHPEVHPLVKVLLFLFGAAASAYPPFVIISFYCEGGTLIANGDGLVLPPGMCGFGPTTAVKWNDVTALDIYTANSGAQTMLLRMSDGKRTRIAMSSLSKDDLEKLLLAMEMWLPGQVWSDNAIAQRDGLQIEAGDNSFTQLWESELHQRYSATTFIPHDPGSKINEHLTVLKQLAFGGFSAVYLGQNSDHEKVVIKELVVQSPDRDMQAKAVEMFDREARLLAKLEHPQIARVYDHFVRDGHTYMVLQYIEGENLRQFVRRMGGQSEECVWGCAWQMAQILAYLHGRQPTIVHRDFTPDNLVLGSSGKVTLIDFGAANEITTRATGTLVGKQAYMPIEQIRGKAEPRSDLYALGCVLFWLVTGTEPEPLSVCRPRRIKSGISQTMDDLVARLTALEPEKRFSSAAELVRFLERRRIHGERS